MAVLEDGSLRVRIRMSCFFVATRASTISEATPGNWSVIGFGWDGGDGRETDCRCRLQLQF